MDLKKKILIPTIVMVVLAMGISTAINYFLSRTAFEGNALDRTSMITRSKAELADVWIEDAKALMRTSAGSSEYEGVLKNDTDENRVKANSALADQLKNMAGFSYINIADAQGEVRASTKAESVGKIKVPDREYFQREIY